MAALYGSVALAAPDSNPNPSDRIEFIGTMPDDVAAVLVEDWYTTTDSIFCKHMVGEAGFMPDHVARRAQLVSASNGQRTWLVARDELKPGHCGWALKQVVAYLDSTASGLDPQRPSNLPVRVAYVCAPGEPCANTWGANDDAEKPTYHRCIFASDEPMTPGSSVNRCAVPDEKAHGTDRGKYEHILRPAQHQIRFVVTEVNRRDP